MTDLPSKSDLTKKLIEGNFSLSEVIKEMNLCFDFDGPIIDVSDRYYRAYLESLKGTSINKSQILTKENFWNLKRNRITDFEISLLSGLSINDSKDSAEARKELSFKTEFLEQDKLFEDVHKTFEYLKSKKIIFFIVTLRQKKQLDHAIKHFKLDKYLNDEHFFCINEEHKIINDIQEKHILLVSAINKLNLSPQETWIIGDTETDIHAGRLAKYEKVVAISRGIRSKEQLETVKPDYLVNNLAEIISISQGLSVN